LGRGVIADGVKVAKVGADGEERSIERTA